MGVYAKYNVLFTSLNFKLKHKPDMFSTGEVHPCPLKIYQRPPLQQGALIENVCKTF